MWFAQSKTIILNIIKGFKPSLSTQTWKLSRANTLALSHTLDTARMKTKFEYTNTLDRAKMKIKFLVIECANFIRK